MEVILREDVEKLGRRGEVVKVAEGYGRNFLLPRGLAMEVSEANKAMIAKERKAHEARLRQGEGRVRGAGRAHRRAALRGAAQGGRERRALRLGDLGRRRRVPEGQGRSRSTSARSSSTSRSSTWASTR